ncbi:MAG TPA: hypothetical protein PLS69_06540 [Terricaulis sp.]|nr:hypothetical protein [Terricaulis sp.]
MDAGMNTQLDFTESELERRSQVWAAMSELFIDSDVTLLHAHIARELRKHTYNDTELLHILVREAGPASYPNMLSVAGEWIGYEPAEARAIVLRYLRLPAPLRWLRRIAGAALVNGVIDAHWNAILMRKAEKADA